MFINLNVNTHTLFMLTPWFCGYCFYIARLMVNSISCSTELRDSLSGN